MSAQPDVPSWRLVGDWWDLCNCAIGCPCNFGSDPTLGYCEGVLTWLIRDGRHRPCSVRRHAHWATKNRSSPYREIPPKIL
jgi:hypothetical protein